MSDAEILRELIRNDILVKPSTKSLGNEYLELKETSGDQPYSVRIRNIPSEVTAFKSDEFPAPSKFFNCKRGECKRADFIIIANTPTENWIVYIEMKGGCYGSGQAIEKQLQGSECVIAYCRAIGQSFWKEQNFLAEKNYKQRFVSIKGITIKKRPTTTMPTIVPSRSDVHDEPSKMLKITSPPSEGLEFREIVNDQSKHKP